MGDGTGSGLGSALASPTCTLSGSHCVGRIVAFEHGCVLVDYPGNQTGRLSARTTLQLDAATWARAAAAGAEALLVFEGGHEHGPRPIVVGLLAPIPDASSTQQPLTAAIDGTRVVIEAADEIVLRCGHASITLRRNGRVVIQGKYVETYSQGVNRIKGGSVQIN